VVVIEKPAAAPKTVQKKAVEIAAPLGLEQPELLHNR
jgi:hypothetical protein